MSLPSPVDGAAPGYHGVYPALVTNIVDPDRLGRVQVSFPWLGSSGETDVRAWATLCSPYADNNQGLLALPEVDSQVVVAFEAGNLRRPYILGAAWNGQAQLPESPAAPNNIRLLRSRSNSRLEFDDQAGAEKVTISMAAGHEVVLDNAARTITVRHGTGCVITLTDTNVDIQANASLKVTAPTVTVNAGMSTFSGVVKVDTLIATTGVVSPSYTPGAGNIW
jgi:uncharacterized protein involved in type VI secretion and phage assembly